MPLDWKDIPGDSKEKYAMYLCSREWSELKRAVHDRAGGLCERCGVNPIDAVHHLTYARKYRERLEDLQGNCNACHKFTHGHSDEDPADQKFEMLMPTCGSVTFPNSGDAVIDKKRCYLEVTKSSCGELFLLHLTVGSGENRIVVEMEVGIENLKTLAEFAGLIKNQ